jgi:hypothetical protein
LFLSFYMQDQDQHLSWHWCPISSHPSYLVRTYVTDNLFTSSSNLQSFFTTSQWDVACFMESKPLEKESKRLLPACLRNFWHEI